MHLTNSSWPLNSSSLLAFTHFESLSLPLKAGEYGETEGETAQSEGGLGGTEPTKTQVSQDARNRDVAVAFPLRQVVLVP